MAGRREGKREGGGLPGQQNVIGLKLAEEPIETKAITEANSIRVTGCWWLPAAKLLHKHYSFPYKGWEGTWC